MLLAGGLVFLRAPDMTTRILGALICIIAALLFWTELRGHKKWRVMKNNRAKGGR